MNAKFLKLMLMSVTAAAIAAAVIMFALQIVGDLDPTRHVYVIRLEPKSQEPLTPASVTKSVDILRMRINKRGGRRIGIESGGVLTGQIDVYYQGGTGLEMMLNDQRLEIHELADSREWRDEFTALAALGGNLPKETLIIPTTNQESINHRVFLVRKKTLLTNCDFDSVKKKFWSDPDPQLTVKFGRDAVRKLGDNPGADPAPKYAFIIDGQLLKTAGITELSASEFGLSGLTDEQVDTLILISQTGCTPHRFLVEKNYTIQH